MADEDNPLPQHWPNDTPEEVQRVANLLWAIVRFQNSNVGGPAMMLVMMRMIMSIKDNPSGKDVMGILEDLSHLMIKWGAANERRDEQLN